MKKGDEVRWESGGKKKRGEIVAVVEAGKAPADALDITVEAVFEFDGNGPRNHESYLVLVKNGEKKPSLYWPITSKLKPVNPGPKELPGMAETRTPLGKACQEFVAQAHAVAEEKKELREAANKIMEEMRKDGKESLTVEAAGDRYNFRVRPTGFKLDWNKVKD